MEFKRKKKRGINQKTCRLWFSAEGYRITWRKKVFGVNVPARFQVCIRTIVPGNFENDSTEIWDLVNRSKPLYRSIKTAVADCKRHQKLWKQAVECTSIRAIQELFGRKPIGVPKWAAAKLNRRVLAILLDTQPGEYIDETETSKKRSRRKSISKESISKITSKVTSKKRKQRSDKGKKRGPRKGIKK